MTEFEDELLDEGFTPIEDDFLNSFARDIHKLKEEDTMTFEKMAHGMQAYFSNKNMGRRGQYYSLVGLLNSMNVLRSDFEKYEKLPQFKRLISMAKQMVEEQTVNLLFDNKTAHGAKYALDKFFKYEAKVESPKTNNIFLLANLGNPNSSIDEAIRDREIFLQNS